MYYTIYEGFDVPYIALAKKTPFIHGIWLHEPGVIGFEYGETEEEALSNLKRNLPNNTWEKWEKEEKT